MRPRPEARTRWAVAAVLTCLVLTSCTDDGGDEADTTTTTSVAGRPTATTGAPGTDPAASTTTPAPATTVAEDDLPPDALPYVEAIEQGAGDATDRCSIVQFVDLVGIDRLAATGFDVGAPPDDGLDAVLGALALDAAEAAELHDRMAACGHDFVGELVEDLVTGRTDDPAVTGCLRERIDPAVVRDVFVASLQGLEPDTSGLDDLGSCFGG